MRFLVWVHSCFKHFIRNLISQVYFFINPFIISFIHLSGISINISLESSVCQLCVLDSSQSNKGKKIVIHIIFFQCYYQTAKFLSDSLKTNITLYSKQETHPIKIIKTAITRKKKKNSYFTQSFPFLIQWVFFMADFRVNLTQVLSFHRLIFLSNL